MRLLPALLVIASTLQAQNRPRARDLGVPFDGTPGPLNAITDVAGVTVGHATIIKGAGTLVVGQGPVRTGVTAIFPRGATNGDPVFGGWFTLNGNGEMTGTTWLEESGFLAGPVMITNTHSVGVVRDAVIEWLVRKGFEFDWSLPVVAETWDGSLNDINGFHVTKAHAFAALDSAHGGPVVEGNVGGGTGMICNQFKGGMRRCCPISSSASPSAPLGVGRLGGTGGNPSGDIFVALSTANPGAAKPDASVSVTMLPNERIDPLFQATIPATEEAIVNAMVAAETMTGINGMRVYALPHERLRAALRKYNRLVEPRR